MIASPAFLPLVDGLLDGRRRVRLLDLAPLTRRLVRRVDDLQYLAAFLARFKAVVPDSAVVALSIGNAQREIKRALA